MQALRIVAEGVTTSFRYPHFMISVQPTYPMPPPATIYGHICSALGEWIDPATVRFAYHFTHEGEFSDLEHVHIVGASTGKLKGTEYPKVLEGRINPFQRQQLFRPRLTLYLDRPEWEEAFRRPRYTVVLGRSQDLMTYTDVRVVELQEAERAYVQHTLLPRSMSTQVMRGVTITMPRWVDVENGRNPFFDQYLTLGADSVILPPDPDDLTPRFAGMEYGPYWTDPDAPTWRDAPRAVIWHSFTES